VGQLVEVLAVAVEEIASDGPLLGASIDGPQAGRAVAAHAVEIGGWALGARGRVSEVEAALDGAVVARAPVSHPRPDIAAAFPKAAGAASAGFELLVDIGKGAAEVELEVRAQVGSTAVPIGGMRLRRRWRGGPEAGESPLVSAIVIWEDDGQDLERTLRSVVEQRPGSTIESLVVHPAGLGDAAGAWRERGVRSLGSQEPGAAALRNTGIQRSNGHLLLFLEAGTVLADGALGRCLESLERRPEAAGVVDAPVEGTVAAAIYRRAAFEELGGFDGRPGRSTDRRLARRAAEYRALFEPGILVGRDRS
jgi:hypothetical protein